MADANGFKPGENESNEEKNVLNNHVDAESESTDEQADDSCAKIIDEESSGLTSICIAHAAELNEFACLKKDDLLQYANDPFWVRVRVGLLVLFGLAWFGMLIAAIAIIVVAPKCPPQPKLGWWQKAVVYHVHPQSFKDSNGDGFGDIKGIIEKIDYLEDNLHVNAVSIGPMNPSPNFNYGYNIANFNTTCPHHYGTLTEFESLRATLHKKGIKLLLDFIPNHTSRSHQWFKNSVNMSALYKDYYVWHPGRIASDGTKQPPNNWLSVYGGSAWTFNEQRQEFYYHTFSEDEPDLNLRNDRVVADLDASLRLWLSRGVDGFRFYGVQYLVESANVTENEPVIGDTKKSSDYWSLIHDHTTFQPESYDLVTHWRQLLDDFSNDDGRAKSRYYPRLMIAEVNGTVDQTIAFSAKNAEGLPGAHIATNKALLAVKSGCRAQCVYDLVTDWYSKADASDVWSNWQLGNVDVSRLATRVSQEDVNAFNMLLLTLPGTSFVYYGEELGMKDLEVNAVACTNVSVLSNPCYVANRAPMQWSDGSNAGFTTANKTWQPVNDNYHTVNVKAQLAHGSDISSLQIFSNLSALHQQPSFLWGKFHPSTVANVFFFTRQAEGFPGFLVATNLGPTASTVDFKAANRFELPDFGEVVATTGHFEGPWRYEAFRLGNKVQMANVHLKPGEGIIVRW